MQGWDYRLGINGVKRMQAAYNSALVAQGAFSAYWTDDLRAVGGWPDAIGEDIVLTWTLMRLARDRAVRALRARASRPPRDARALHAPALTLGARHVREAPDRTRRVRQPRVLAKFVAGIDYLVPLLDIGFIFFWIPGLILFVFGYPLIVSWWSMLVIPITVIVYGLLRRWQERHVFRRLDVHPKDDAARLLRLPVRSTRRSLVRLAPRLPPVPHRGSRRWR